MNRTITRRKVLQTGSTVVAASALFGKFANHLHAEILPAQPGIQLYTVGKELRNDVPGTLKDVRSIGYIEVETAGFAGLTAKPFRAALDVAGLKCISSHFFDYRDPDPGPFFADANTLGVRYVVTSVINALIKAPAGQLPTLDNYKAMADFLNKLGQKAKDAGLQLAYHNHSGEFKDLGGGKMGYDVLLEQTDPDLLKFELDCGWIVAGGQNPVDYFKRYPNRYRMIHVKDFILSPGHEPQGVVLGKGVIDYKPIFVAAKAAGVEQYYVEQEPPFIGTTALEAAKLDYEYVRALNG
jgi:sugar phosphate isomerase/epimerase